MRGGRRSSMGWDGFPLRREDPRGDPFLFFSFLLLELQEYGYRSQLLTRQYQYEYPYPIPSRDSRKTPSLPSVCFMQFLQKKAKIASATPYRVNLAAAELLAGLPRLPSLCSGHKYRQGILIRRCLFLEYSRILKQGQSIGSTCSLIIRVDQCRDNIQESSAGSQESDMVGSLLCCHESRCFSPRLLHHLHAIGISLW